VANPNGSQCIGLLIRNWIASATDGATGEGKITAKSFGTCFEAACPGTNTFSFSFKIPVATLLYKLFNCVGVEQ